MRALVIGASSESIIAIKKLKKRGAFIIGLDGDKNARGFEYVDKKIVVDITNFNEIEVVLKEEKFDFIVPVPVGKILTTIGYLNEKYNMIGIGYRGALNCTDKYLFHALLNKNGLRNIRSYLIKKDELIDTSMQVNYPVILKPRFGSGSKGIYTFKNKDEMKKTIKTTLNEDYILEEIVEGEEYGVDAIILNNKLEVLLLRKKENINFQAVSYYSVVDGKKYEQVKNFLEKVLKVLEVNNVILHADLILNKDGIFVIELSGRPSGHKLHNYFTPMVIGVDILDNYFNFLYNLEYSFVVLKRKNMVLKFIDFENCIIKKIPTIEKLKKIIGKNLKEFNCALYEGQKLGKIENGNSIAERGFFILEGKNEEKLKEMIEIILKEFDIERIENGK